MLKEESLPNMYMGDYSLAVEHGAGNSYSFETIQPYSWYFNANKPIKVFYFYYYYPYCFSGPWAGLYIGCQQQKAKTYINIDYHLSGVNNCGLGYQTVQTDSYKWIYLVLRYNSYLLFPLNILSPVEIKNLYVK